MNKYLVYIQEAGDDLRWYTIGAIKIYAETSDKAVELAEMLYDNHPHLNFTDDPN